MGRRPGTQRRQRTLAPLLPALHPANKLCLHVITGSITDPLTISDHTLSDRCKDESAGDIVVIEDNVCNMKEQKDQHFLAAG